MTIERERLALETKEELEAQIQSQIMEVNAEFFFIRDELISQYKGCKRDRSDMLTEFRHLKNKCLLSECTQSQINRDMITIKEFCYATRDLFGEVKGSVKSLNVNSIFDEKYSKLMKWVDEIGKE